MIDLSLFKFQIHFHFLESFLVYSDLLQQNEVNLMG